MPRPRANQRDQIQSDTRKALLDAAIRAFANSGYERAKVDEISKDAGFAKGTIYNYFASKRDLMLALIKVISNDHYDFIAMQVLETDDISLRLQRFFEAGFTWVVEHPAQARILITTLNSADRELKTAMYNGYAPMFALVHAQILDPGIRSGDFRQVDPGPTSGLIMSTYLGTCSQVDEQGRPFIDPNDVADFMLHALQPSTR